MKLFNTKHLIFLICVLAVLISGCTSKSSEKINQNSNTPSPTQTEIATASATPSSSPSATPKNYKSITPKSTGQGTIDCIGPDGKSAKMTQKACDDFRKAWNLGTPTPTPAPQITGCAAYNPTGPLGAARVTVKLENGQDWRGTAVVTFSQKYTECRGNGIDYAWQDYLTGPKTKDYGAFRPGPYKVEVTYYNKKWSTDVNLNGGTSEVTITLSNN